MKAPLSSSSFIDPELATVHRSARRRSPLRERTARQNPQNAVVPQTNTDRPAARKRVHFALPVSSSASDESESIFDSSHPSTLANTSKPYPNKTPSLTSNTMSTASSLYMDEDGIRGPVRRSVRQPEERRTERHRAHSTSTPGPFLSDDGMDDDNPWNWPQLPKSRRVQQNRRERERNVGTSSSDNWLTARNIRTLRAIVCRPPRTANPSRDTVKEREKQSKVSTHQTGSKRLSTIAEKPKSQDPWDFPRLDSPAKQQLKGKGKKKQQNIAKARFGDDVERVNESPTIVEYSRQDQKKDNSNQAKKKQKQKNRYEKPDKQPTASVNVSQLYGGESSAISRPPGESPTPSVKIADWNMEPHGSPPVAASGNPPSPLGSGFDLGRGAWPEAEGYATRGSEKNSSKGSHRSSESRKAPSVAAGSVFWGSGNNVAGAGAEVWADAINNGVAIGGSHKSGSGGSRHSGSRGSGSRQGSTRNHGWPLDTIPEDPPAHSPQQSDGWASKRDEEGSKHSSANQSHRRDSHHTLSPPKPPSKVSAAHSSYHVPTVEEDPANWHGWQNQESESLPKPRSQKTASSHKGGSHVTIEEWRGSVKAATVEKLPSQKSSSRKGNRVEAWSSGKPPSYGSMGTGYEKREDIVARSAASSSSARSWAAESQRSRHSNGHRGWEDDSVGGGFNATKSHSNRSASARSKDGPVGFF